MRQLRQSADVDPAKVDLGPVKAEPTDLEKLAELRRPTLTLQFALALIRRTGGNVYRFTVPAHVVAGRRRRNKAARLSRRVNRKRAA